MALFELQFRKSAALGAIKSEINRRRLPFPEFPAPYVIVNPSLRGASLQRIECLECTMDPSAGDGQVIVQAQVVFHHNTLPEVQAAGSLQTPETHQFPATVPLQLSVVSVPAPARPGQVPMPDQVALQWSLPLGFLSENIPIRIPAGNLPGSDVLVVGAIEADDNVVALRLGTNQGDPVNAPIQDRLGEADWVFAVPGQPFADFLAASLSEVLHEKLPSGAVLDGGVSGAWVPPFGDPYPSAIASATINVHDQCVFGIVVPVSLSLKMTLQASGDTLVQTLVLNWETHSLLCDLAAGAIFLPFAPLIISVVSATVIDALISSAVSGVILGTDFEPGHDFEEIGRTDSSITYQRTSFLDTPSPRLLLTDSGVDKDGLSLRGKLTMQAPPRGLEGWVDLPESRLGMDCQRRSVDVVFDPPQVTFRDTGIEGGAPQLFPGRAWFVPPGAWQVKLGKSNSWLDLSLTFADPPDGRLPAGTSTSVWLHTDCGLRWVDLGVIPAEHPPPTVGDTAQMISQCMPVSDPWDHDVLHIKWRVDPPDSIRGLDAVRQWSLGFRDLPASARLEFAALGPRGAERHLGVVEGHRSVAVELATDADETLEVRAGSQLDAPAPLVFQRWVVPFATVPLEDGETTVASSEGMIGVRDRRGQIRLIDAGNDGGGRIRIADGRMHVEPGFRRLENALAREGRRGLGSWAVATYVSEGVTAVTHRGRLVIGRTLPAVRL